MPENTKFNIFRRVSNHRKISHPRVEDCKRPEKPKIDVKMAKK
jgi:hypothetical protein